MKKVTEVDEEEAKARIERAKVEQHNTYELAVIRAQGVKDSTPH
jgi:hypothetical protein